MKATMKCACVARCRSILTIIAVIAILISPVHSNPLQLSSNRIHKPQEQASHEPHPTSGNQEHQHYLDPGSTGDNGYFKGFLNTVFGVFLGGSGISQSLKAQKEIQKIVVREMKQNIKVSKDILNNDVMVKFESADSENQKIPFKIVTEPEIPERSVQKPKEKITFRNGWTVIGAEQEVEENRKQKAQERRVFVCYVPRNLTSCPIGTDDLEEHIDTLLEENLKNLKHHVEILQKSYHRRGGKVRQHSRENEVEQNLSSDKPHDTPYQTSIKSTLEDANIDLIKIACYLNKAKQDALAVTGEQRQLRGFKTVICGMRKLMDGVNATIAEVIKMESDYLHRDTILPDHIRTEFELTVLNELSDYLGVLKSNVEFVKQVRAMSG